MDKVYVNMDGRSAKVWGCDSFTNEKTGKTTVIWYWGSIGKHMSELTKKEVTYPNYAKAYDAITSKIDEKTRKGYRSVPNERYFQCTMDYRIDVEQLIKGIYRHQIDILPKPDAQRRKIRLQMRRKRILRPVPA